MSKVLLGKVLIEQRQTVGTADGDNLPLIGVDNKTGLHLSRQKRLADVSRYKLLRMHWFAYNPMRINIGSIGYADSESKTGIISPDYVVFSCSDQILPEYFLHFIKSDIGLREIARHTGGSVRERLYFRYLAKIEIELPAIEEQHKIVYALNKRKQLLNTLFDECRLLEQETQLLRSTILQEAVHGKLTQQDHNDEPASVLLQRIKAEKQKLVKEGKLKKEKELPPITEEEIPFELPKGWEWCRLGNIITMMDSGWSPACKEMSAQEGVWGILKTTAVQKMEYLQNENKELPETLSPKEQYEVKSGDILITRAGPFNRVGICCLVNTTRNKLMISDKIIRFHLVEKGLIPDFVVLCLNTGASKEYIESKKSGMALSQVNISQDNLKLTPIPAPPLAEQKRIVAKVQQLQQQLSGLEVQVQQNQQYAQQLLQTVLKEAFKEKEYEVNEEITLAAES